MKNLKNNLYTLPMMIWLTLFFTIPSLIIVVYSFLKKGTYGGVEWIFSLDGYRALLDDTLLKVALFTLIISIVVTLITVLLAVPTAYYIARSKNKKILLFFVIIPFWTNLLIRIYAWIALLGNEGFFNGILMKLGIISEPIQMMYNIWAIIIISIYTNLPFAILPLYAVIEKFDFSMLEAARDLGSTNRQAFFKVFLPNIKSGILTSAMFAFVPTFGTYAVPKLVGGKNSLMLGTIVAARIEKRNWPAGAAIATIMIAITVLAVVFFLRKEDEK